MSSVISLKNPLREKVKYRVITLSGESWGYVPYRGPSPLLYRWGFWRMTIIASIVVGGVICVGYIFPTPTTPSAARETALPAVSQPATEVYPQ